MCSVERWRRRIGAGLVVALIASLAGCGWVDAGVSGDAAVGSGVLQGPGYSVAEGDELFVSRGEGLLRDHDDPDAETILVSEPVHAADFELRANGAFYYAHDGSETRQDRFRYKIQSGADEVLAEAVLTIEPVNDPPISDDQTVQTLSGRAIAGRVTATDPDNPPTDLSYLPRNSPNNGRVDLQPDGSFVYTPDDFFYGVDRFSIAIVDPDGADSVAEITVEVAPSGGGTGPGGPNRPPTVSDVTLETAEDQTVTQALQATDPDGDSLTYSVTAPTNGVASVNDAGVVEYGGNPDFNGADQFTVTVTDAQGATTQATVSVNVLPVNDPPVPGSPTFTVAAGAEAVLEAVATDPDGDTLTYTIPTGEPPKGTVDSPNPADGTFRYSAGPDASGTDTIGFTVGDGQVESTGTVTVEITNQPPEALDDQAGTDLFEDGELSAATGPSLLANDRDPEIGIDGEGLRVVAVNGDTTSPTFGEFGQLFWDETGWYEYRLARADIDADTDRYAAVNALAADARGEEIFRYEVADDANQRSAANLHIFVVGQNDLPVADDDSFNATPGQPLTVSYDLLLANDTDPDADVLSVQALLSPPANVTVNGDGSFSYVKDEAIPEPVSFRYRVDDGAGGTSEALVTLQTNAPPVTAGGCWQTTRNAPVVATLDASDPDSAQPMLFETVTPPADGEVIWENPETGRFRYQPSGGPAGARTFEYRVVDAGGAATTAQVDLLVGPNIMPLGDSITEGYETADGPLPDARVGYRQPLYEALVRDGFTFDFVGSLDNGSAVFAGDTDHEGHGGWSDGQLAADVYAFLQANPADLVLLHIGTNQLAPSSAEVRQLLDDIERWATDNGNRVTVLLARIIDQFPEDPNGWVTAFNDSVAAMVAGRNDQMIDISVVDIQSAFRTVDGVDGTLYADQLHPNADGYLRMAELWYGALINRLDKCAGDSAVVP